MKPNTAAISSAGMTRRTCPIATATRAEPTPTPARVSPRHRFTPPWLVAALALLLALAALPVSAATYYVKSAVNGGNYNNTGLSDAQA